MSTTKNDLFLLAHHNAARLEQLLKEICDNMEADAIQQLADFKIWFGINSRISLNLPPSVLASFSRTGRYINIHGWAREQEELSGRSSDLCLQEKLGVFYKRRIIFDNFFINGDKFVYAAVNAGGTGFSSKFGTFCSVFQAGFPSETDDVAYIADDSLSCCFDATNNFLFNRLSELIAPHSHRDSLAALKLHQQVVSSSPALWSYLVLSDDSYIEAILSESPAFSLVSEVRIKRKHYDELWDLAFANFGRKLSKNVFTIFC